MENPPFLWETCTSAQEEIFVCNPESGSRVHLTCELESRLPWRKGPHFPCRGTGPVSLLVLAPGGGRDVSCGPGRLCCRGDNAEPGSRAGQHGVFLCRNELLPVHLCSSGLNPPCFHLARQGARMLETCPGAVTMQGSH